MLLRAFNLMAPAKGYRKPCNLSTLFNPLIPNLSNGNQSLKELMMQIYKNITHSTKKMTKSLIFCHLVDFNVMFVQLVANVSV